MKDTVDVAALKPCTLNLIEGNQPIHNCHVDKKCPRCHFQITILSSPLSFITEDYDAETATSHVRRLLDIVACTTSFGPSPVIKEDSGKNPPENKAVKKTNKSKHSSTPRTSPPPSEQPPSKDASVDGEGELSNSCPKLGSFYEFFSLSHLTPPIQCKSICTCRYSYNLYIYTYTF